MIYLYMHYVDWRRILMKMVAKWNKESRSSGFCHVDCMRLTNAVAWPQSHEGYLPITSSQFINTSFSINYIRTHHNLSIYQNFFLTKIKFYNQPILEFRTQLQTDSNKIANLRTYIPKLVFALPESFSFS